MCCNRKKVLMKIRSTNCLKWHVLEAPVFQSVKFIKLGSSSSMNILAVYSKAKEYLCFEKALFLLKTLKHKSVSLKKL